MDIEKKICIVCGAAFYPRHSRHICCSDACLKQHKKAYMVAYNAKNKHEKGCHVYRKTCPFCGEEFVTNRSVQKYCSILCCNTSHAERTLQRYHKNKKIIFYKKVCELCGKNFTTTNNNKKTCSFQCAYDMVAQKNRERNANKNKEKEHVVQCKRCGKVFKTHSRRKKYCSVECSEFRVYYYECRMCGAEYATLSKNSMFCSRRCFHQWRNKKDRELCQGVDLTCSSLFVQSNDGVCVICGKHFTAIRRRQKTCSKECRHVYREIVQHFYEVKKRLLFNDDMADTTSVDDSDIHAPIDSVLHGHCPYALGLLRSDSMFLPVW
ncbi:MAG: hypothetical protein R3Y11_09590 [Pseudomonadota bacterium]